MTRAREFETQALEALQRAVAEALERKRRLGQYAVVWRDGRPVCIGPDAPAAEQSYERDASGPRQGVAEPRGDD